MKSMQVGEGLKKCFAAVFCAAAALLLFHNVYAVMACLFFALYGLSDRYERLPHFLPVLFALSFLSRLAVVFLIDTPPVSDFKVLLEAAQRVNLGDTSFKDSLYFSLWPYQSGFVAWQALLLKIWNNPLMIKLVNCLMMAGINCFVYLLARRASTERTARVASLCYLCFAFPLVAAATLTNQHVSAFFLVLGVVLLFCCEKITVPRALLAGVSFALGNVMRPEGIILLAALFGCMLLWSFAVKRREKLLLLRNFVLVLAAYFVINFAAGQAIIAADISRDGLANNNPLWKFVVGLNNDTSGSYSQEDAKWMYEQMGEDFSVTQETLEAERQLIWERLQRSPREWAGFLWRKTGVQWNSSAMYMMLHHWNGSEEPLPVLSSLTKQEGLNLLEQADRGMFYIALLLGILGLWRIFRERGTRPVRLMVPMVVFVSFCAFLVVEAQARYAYLPQIFLFAFAAVGLEALPDPGKRRREKRVELPEAGGEE